MESFGLDPQSISVNTSQGKVIDIPMESTTTDVNWWHCTPDTVLARQIWWVLPWIINSKPLTSSVSSSEVSSASQWDRWDKEVAQSIVVHIGFLRILSLVMVMLFVQ